MPLFAAWRTGAAVTGAAVTGAAVASAGRGRAAAVTVICWIKGTAALGWWFYPYRVLFDSGAFHSLSLPPVLEDSALPPLASFVSALLLSAAFISALFRFFTVYFRHWEYIARVRVIYI